MKLIVSAVSEDVAYRNLVAADERSEIDSVQYGDEAHVTIVVINGNLFREPRKRLQGHAGINSVEKDPGPLPELRQIHEFRILRSEAFKGKGLKGLSTLQIYVRPKHFQTVFLLLDFGELSIGNEMFPFHAIRSTKFFSVLWEANNPLTVEVTLSPELGMALPTTPKSRKDLSIMYPCYADARIGGGEVKLERETALQWFVAMANQINDLFEKVRRLGSWLEGRPDNRIGNYVQSEDLRTVAKSLFGNTILGRLLEYYGLFE